MIHKARNAPIRWALPLSLLAAACMDGGAPTAPDGSFIIQPTVVVDYAAGNGSQFVFLQPLVDGIPSGPLAMGLTPMIDICNTDPADLDPCIQLDAANNGDHYQANWKDRTAKVDEVYTISVTQSGLQLGKLSLTLDGIDGDKAGRTFPIKFWVGEEFGAAVQAVQPCLDDNRCNAEVVPDAVGTIVVTTVDDDTGATMAALSFPEAAVPPGGLIVTLDCREDAGFAVGDGPLPSDLNQWPLFCHVTATNPDGTPFTGVLTSPATMDVCVVDETLLGQGDYHGFDHTDLVLGKSDGPGNFTFLPPVGSSLETCDGNTTTTAMGPGAGILDALGSRLAMAFGLIMPEELRAAPMRFRDGGVGGLITSFSDINPVEPAFIAGTVSHVNGAGLAGVTVTLSGDASAVTTTVGLDGSYQFGPLQAAEGGGSAYTVAVSGLPAGEVVATPSQNVAVVGSGTFPASFVTELPAGVFYFADTGNYYQSFAAQVPWATADANAQALSFRMCGGQLVTILSAEEDAFITDNMPLAAQGTPGGGGYWLGGFQPDESVEPGDGWKWVPYPASILGIPGVNGSAPEYANWAPSEPNNSGGGVGSGAPNTENRLQYLGDWTTVGADKIRWNDEPGNRAYGYVVEYQCPS